MKMNNWLNLLVCQFSPHLHWFSSSLLFTQFLWVYSETYNFLLSTLSRQIIMKLTERGTLHHLYHVAIKKIMWIFLRGFERWKHQILLSRTRNNWLIRSWKINSSFTALKNALLILQENIRCDLWRTRSDETVQETEIYFQN
jgi:hypothetical protein